MKIVNGLPILLILIILKWIADVVLIFLNNECFEEGIFESLLIKLLECLWIKNPTAPPWWVPLCGLTSIQDYVEPTFATFVMAWYLHVFLKITARKGEPLRKKRLRYLKSDLLRGKEGKRKRINESHDSLPRKRQCVNNNNDNFCQIDGEIFIAHGTAANARLHQVLLGPVAVTFQAIRHVLVAAFKTLRIPEAALVWSSRIDPYGNPEFLGVRSQDIRVDVVLDPRQGINIDVQRLGPARGRLREVAYWCYQVTYRGVVCTEQGTSVLYGSRWDP